MRVTSAFTAISLAGAAYAALAGPSHGFTHRHPHKRGGTSSDGWKMYKYLTGDDLIDYFNFDEKASDNQGVANYVDGKSSGLVYTQSNGKVRIGVDQAEDVALRNAVRMTSKETFNPSQNLLFIIDVHQMPSMCGVWPAIWFTGSGTWPETGEIDLVEGVNSYTQNTMSVHSGAGCWMDASNVNGAKLNVDASEGGTNCDANANYQSCGVSVNSKTSFGQAANNVNGASYAVELTTDGIKMWWWNTDHGPVDVNNGLPTPSSWGNPTLQIDSSTCNTSDHFKDLMLIINTNLGGFFTTGVWDVNEAGGQDKCCQDVTGFSDARSYVLSQGSAFGDAAAWVLNGIYIFERQ
ncbi:glycoside hydrolase family 16 protein [Armillaria mellea]|nr:glycoside hydrolase family 16 protein [Armillaria mellea]